MADLHSHTLKWAKRVPKWKIARLYEDDARGLHDEDRVNDVAFILLARCKSMVMVEAARNGRAACPRCEALIEHPVQRGFRLDCDSCGWSGLWQDYRASFKKRHLIAPGLQHFCKEYIRQMPRVKTARERMYWIDWLIHRVHWEGTSLPGQPGAVCLVQGRAQDVNAFLAALSADTHRTADPADFARFWSPAEQQRLKKWHHAAKRRAARRRQDDEKKGR